MLEWRNFGVRGRHDEEHECGWMSCKGLYDEGVVRKPYHGCMMYVMAVQETQYESIVERVGVSVIFEQAWLKSAAEQGIVFLG